MVKMAVINIGCILILTWWGVCTVITTRASFGVSVGEYEYEAWSSLSRVIF